MDRYAIYNLFGIKGFNIAWYGIIIAMGMLAGIALAQYRAKKQKMDNEIILDFVIIGIPVSIICARLYYVIFEWDQYKDNLIKIFATREGGLAIFGGVIGGFITAYIFCRKKKIYFLKFMDIAIPSLLLGQIVGRWGNFMNQEAYGNIVTNLKYQKFPFSVYIERIGEWHQATFFYESFLNVLLLIVILIVEKKFKKNGNLLALYFIGYGIIRFMVEGLRSDSLYLLSGIRVSQMLALLLVPIGIMLLVWIQKKGTYKNIDKTSAK